MDCRQKSRTRLGEVSPGAAIGAGCSGAQAGSPANRNGDFENRLKTGKIAPFCQHLASNSIVSFALIQYRYLIEVISKSPDN